MPRSRSKPSAGSRSRERAARKGRGQAAVASAFDPFEPRPAVAIEVMEKRLGAKAMLDCEGRTGMESGSRAGERIDGRGEG